jgi:hypothetical protein
MNIAFRDGIKVLPVTLGCGALSEVDFPHFDAAHQFKPRAYWIIEKPQLFQVSLLFQSTSLQPLCNCPFARVVDADTILSLVSFETYLTSSSEAK